MKTANVRTTSALLPCDKKVWVKPSMKKIEQRPGRTSIERSRTTSALLPCKDKNVPETVSG